MDDTYRITDEDYEQWTSRMEAREGDCVITNVGRVGAVAQIPSRLRAALGRNMTGVPCRAEFAHPTLLVEALLSDAMREEIDRKTDSGTILNALNVRNIPLLRFIQPSARVAEGFENVARPFRRRIEHNLAESRMVGELRDALLPKLISGELRVPEAEAHLSGSGP